MTTDDQGDSGEMTSAANDDGDEQPEAPEEQTGRVPAPPPITPKKASSSASSKKDEEEAKKKRGRPTGKIGRIPEGVENPHEADLLWPDVIERIHNEGLATHNMVIRVARTSPGPYQMLDSIEASAVEGGGDHDRAPADLLRDAIINTFHISQPGPATYEVTFCWKRGATFYDRGKLSLPSMREIELIRNAQYRQNADPPQHPTAQQRAPQGVGAPPPAYPPAYQSGFQPPPPQHAYPYPQHVPPPPAVQPPPQTSGDSAILELVREMRADQLRLSQRIDQIASGQHHPPPAPAAHGLGADALDAIQQFAKAAEALKPFGVSFTGPGVHVPQGVGAPPPPQPQYAPPPPVKPAPPPRSNEEILIEAIKGLEDQKKLARRAAEALGITLPDENAAPEEEEEEEEKKDKGPGLGFIPMPIPNAHWPDGSPMQHATDQDGNWDIGGIVMSNPYIISTFGGQALKIVEKLMAQKGLGAGPTTPQETAPAAEEQNGAKQPWKL